MLTGCQVGPRGGVVQLVVPLAAARRDGVQVEPGCDDDAVEGLDVLERVRAELASSEAAR